MKCNFFLLFIFFNFSKELLQNGRSVYTNVQNSFFTPGDQDMKLRNKSNEMKKMPCPLRQDAFFCLFEFFFLLSQEVLQNGQNMSKNGQNSTFLPLVAKI